MSNAIYPTLAGLTYSVVKTPNFNTRKQIAVSGRESRTALMAFPLYRFKLSYEILRDDPALTTPASPFDELKQLEGFFLARQGEFDSFLFTDPSDFLTTDNVIGFGDGNTTQFQLIRTYGVGQTFIEPVNNQNVVTNVKDNGSTVSNANYNVSSTGLVTFNNAPVAGHSLSWTGTYYYRVRFDDDKIDFENFMQNLWNAKEVILYGSPANKV